MDRRLRRPEPCQHISRQPRVYASSLRRPGGWPRPRGVRASIAPSATAPSPCTPSPRRQTPSRTRTLCSRSSRSRARGAALGRRPTRPGGSGNSPREGDPIPTHVLALSSRRTRTRQGEIGARSKMTMLNTFERRLHQEIERLSQSKPFQPTDAKPTVEGVYSELSHRIIGAAIEVHRHLGPGQLESVYERALAQELAFREIPHRTQVPITVLLQGLLRRRKFFADLIVDDKIVVRLKGGHRASRGARRTDAVVSGCGPASPRSADQLQRARAVSRRAPADSVRRLRANDPEMRKSSSRQASAPPLPLRRLVIPSWPICIVGRESATSRRWGRVPLKVDSVN